jgi:hypothetical protein
MDFKHSHYLPNLQHPHPYYYPDAGGKIASGTNPAFNYAWNMRPTRINFCENFTLSKNARATRGKICRIIFFLRPVSDRIAGRKFPIHKAIQHTISNIHWFLCCFAFWLYSATLRGTVSARSSAELIGAETRRSLLEDNKLEELIFPRRLFHRDFSPINFFPPFLDFSLLCLLNGRFWIEFNNRDRLYFMGSVQMSRPEGSR